jgi:hypothetical protein
MASTAQVCLPYSGVEKERRCGVALSGLSSGATANALTTRQTLWRAFLKFGVNLLRTFDPIAERISVFADEAHRLCFRTADDAGRSLA